MKLVPLDGLYINEVHSLKNTALSIDRNLSSVNHISPPKIPCISWSTLSYQVMTRSKEQCRTHYQKYVFALQKYRTGGGKGIFWMNAVGDTETEDSQLKKWIDVLGWSDELSNLDNKAIAAPNNYKSDNDSYIQSDSSYKHGNIINDKKVQKKKETQHSTEKKTIAEEDGKALSLKQTDIKATSYKELSSSIKKEELYTLKIEDTFVSDIPSNHYDDGLLSVDMSILQKSPYHTGPDAENDIYDDLGRPYSFKQDFLPAKDINAIGIFTNKSTLQADLDLESFFDMDDNSRNPRGLT